MPSIPVAQPFPFSPRNVTLKSVVSLTLATIALMLASGVLTGCHKSDSNSNNLSDAEFKAVTQRGMQQMMLEQSQHKPK